MLRYQQNRGLVAVRGEEGSETHSVEDPSRTTGADLACLQETARRRENVFASLMQAVKTHSLGQIRHALCSVGGG